MSRHCSGTAELRARYSEIVGGKAETAEQQGTEWGSPAVVGLGPRCSTWTPTLRFEPSSVHAVRLSSPSSNQLTCWHVPHLLLPTPRTPLPPRQLARH